MAVLEPAGKVTSRMMSVGLPPPNVARGELGSRVFTRTVNSEDAAPVRVSSKRAGSPSRTSESRALILISGR